MLYHHPVAKAVHLRDCYAYYLAPIPDYQVTFTPSIENLTKAEAGYTLCINHFVTGGKPFKMVINSNTFSNDGFFLNDTTLIQLAMSVQFFSCRRNGTCDVNFKVGDIVNQVHNVWTNRWMFFCVEFDLVNHSIQFSLDNVGLHKQNYNLSLHNLR